MDLIYFDYEKAKSINSQLKGGLISQLSRAIEDEGGMSADVGFDIKIFKGSLGSAGKEKTVRTETIEVFHELLNEVERALFDKKILADVNDSFENSNSSFNNFLEKVPGFTYIKATGWSAFEDFERFKRIMKNFNDVQRLVNSSLLDSNPQIIELKNQINIIKRGFKENRISDRGKEKAKLVSLERSFDDIMKKNTDSILLDEPFIERVETFLDTFSPDRLNFRLAPFDVYNDFQILANLNSKYLVNGDFESVIYTYGSRPNIKLSVFGIITSCPQKNDKRVNLNDEYLGYSDDELSNEAQFEKAFRDVFSSFEAFEKFFFVPSFPKISLSPIAIYRDVKLQ